MDRFSQTQRATLKLAAVPCSWSVTFLQRDRRYSERPESHPGASLGRRVGLFLLVVLTGASYEYFAVKFLEWKSGVPRTHRHVLDWLIKHHGQYTG